MKSRVEILTTETITDISIHEALCAIMKTNAATYDAASKIEIENLFSYCCEGMENDSQKFLATLFIKALNKKIGSDTISENIYEKQNGVSQIELFNILIDKFPYVKFSQRLINNAIVDIIKQNNEVTIIDIGVGLGTQMVNIIEMAKHLTHLTKLTIVGIEPFAEALTIADKNISAYKGKVPFHLEFIAITEYAENFDFASLQNMQGKVIVNASLALHHIQSQTQRNNTIANIKAINPTAFILTEPNVNHFETDFYSRFKNCYNHFYSLFQVIDKLTIENNYKNGLKLFFGREIEDIIGKPEADRFEKHEPATHWIEKLKANQFNITNKLLKDSIETESGVEIKYHEEGFIGFTYENETALSLIYAN